MKSNRTITLTTNEATVIGALMHHLDWIEAREVSLKIDDFNLMNHKVLYSLLRERYLENNLEISAEALFFALDSHPAKDKTTITLEYCQNLKMKVGAISFDTFIKEAERLNKAKILRALSTRYNIDQFIGEDSVISTGLSEKLDQFSVDEIIESYRIELDEIEETIDSSKNKTSATAAEGLRELVESFKESPQVGSILAGDLYNTIVRGARLGKFYINSAASGVGKTRMMVANMVQLSMPYIDDDGRIVYKSSGYEKSLFISTEQDYTEIQTIVLSAVSGVNEEKIITNELSWEEIDRIELALKIIEKYNENIYYEWISNPTVALLRLKVEKYIRQKDVHYIFFDYIFASAGLNTEFKASIREDVVLTYMSDTLKNLAAENNVFIMSATQLNAEWFKGGDRNIGMLRGSKGIADKIDIGSITGDINDEDLTKISGIVEELGCEVPTLVTDIYKNRGGSLNFVKVFRVFDKGTARIKDLFVTRSNYEVIPLKVRYVEDIELLDNYIELERKP